MEPTTLLLRQVHPSQWDGAHVSSVAFRPKESDAGLLSVYDGDQISAEGSHQHYVEHSKLQSVGVWAVTVQEAEDTALPSRLDVVGHYPEHAVIDFTAHSKSQQKVKASLLADKAEKRGCRYQPPTPPPTA